MGSLPMVGGSYPAGHTHGHLHIRYSKRQLICLMSWVSGVVEEGKGDISLSNKSPYPSIVCKPLQIFNGLPCLVIISHFFHTYQLMHLHH
jgi:hypothetical protein